MRHAVAGGAARSASDRFGRVLRGAARLAGRPASEVRHVHAVERRGESAETPLIAFLGLLLFLVPIFLAMLALAFTAYYLS